MNTVQGRVEFLGNRSGISGLLVRVAAINPTSPRAERSMGSTVTEGGAFTVKFDDDAFKTGPDDRSRPNLIVSIFAPESPDSTPESRLPHRSEVCDDLSAVLESEYGLADLRPALVSSKPSLRLPSSGT